MYNTIHKAPSELAGKTLKIKEEANEIGGREIEIEDYWDRIAGVSWRNSDGNPAAMGYAMRTGLSKVIRLPYDDEVLYGKIGMSGVLVHIKELEVPA